MNWTVKAGNGSTVTSGTTIDDKGKLTLAPTQTGELLVTASVDISDAQDGSDLVTGESIVTVNSTIY